MESPEAAEAPSDVQVEETGAGLALRALRAILEAATATQALANRYDALIDIAAGERVAKGTGKAPAGKGKESPAEEAAAIGDAKGKDKAP